MKKGTLPCRFFAWRRNRDSNPSALLQAYELSKPAPSTTWVFLHIDLWACKIIDTLCPSDNEKMTN